MHKNITNLLDEILEIIKARYTEFNYSDTLRTYKLGGIALISNSGIQLWYNNSKIPIDSIDSEDRWKIVQDYRKKLDEIYDLMENYRAFKLLASASEELKKK